MDVARGSSFGSGGEAEAVQDGSIASGSSVLWKVVASRAPFCEVPTSWGWYCLLLNLGKVKEGTFSVSGYACFPR